MFNRLGTQQTMEESLNKIRKVSAYLDKRGYIHCQVPVPSILGGHKVRVVLADGNNN